MTAKYRMMKGHMEQKNIAVRDSDIKHQDSFSHLLLRRDSDKSHLLLCLGQLLCSKDSICFML